ncbi:hypothetical protein [uncultured Kordia sp.]|uniref:hypothetical protein n=1 Tax=uncultured Kordia sp. TaxID=507699 RepID=UPI00262ADA5B|nr:hypothetical protein [uncultured Kordia sp.]
MDLKIQKLLTDMIDNFDYRVVAKPDNSLIRAKKEIEISVVNSRVVALFGWIDPREHNLPDFNPNKYVIYERDFMSQEVFEEVSGEFKLVFEKIPELNYIFKLKEEHVEFNSSLSKNDIEEIYEFVKTNYNVPIRDFQRRTR